MAARQSRSQGRRRTTAPRRPRARPPRPAPAEAGGGHASEREELLPARNAPPALPETASPRPERSSPRRLPSGRAPKCGGTSRATRHSGGVTYETRTLTPDDLDGVWEVLGHAFGGPNTGEDKDVEFAIVDPKRFYGTYDGATPVPAGGSFAMSMTIPGGMRPAAGVTWLGVLPTHRRRGLLTALKRRMLDDLHAAGEPVAALWASEGAIYQRFGYGPAAWNVALSVPSKAAFNRSVSATGLRLTTPDAAVLAPVFD